MKRKLLKTDQNNPAVVAYKEAIKRGMERDKQESCPFTCDYCRDIEDKRATEPECVEDIVEKK